MSSNAPIGFIDSGIGGVTVLTKALKLMPNENYVFFSDSVNNPYGDKSDEEIIGRCFELTKMLVEEKGCKAVVLACNTASAKAVKSLRESFPNLPIFAIEPAYKMVHDLNPQGFTLVMATRGTIQSEKFRRLYYKYYNHKTALLACVGMADLIEQGKTEELKAYLEKLLSSYKGKAENVVLGCTHYPLAKKEIESVLGKVNFFDGSIGISNQTLNVLKERELLTDKSEKGTILFMDSSPTEEMRVEKEERFFKIIGEEDI